MPDQRRRSLPPLPPTPKLSDEQALRLAGQTLLDAAGQLAFDAGRFTMYGARDSVATKSYQHRAKLLVAAGMMFNKANKGRNEPPEAD